MRRENLDRMTVVEQLIRVREDACSYMCKYKEDIESLCNDEVVKDILLRDYCYNCPIAHINYEGFYGYH